MDKKLVVFFIFISLFILGGLKFAYAAGTVRSGIVANEVYSDTSVTLVVDFAATDWSGTIAPHNFSVYYNTSGSAWTQATLTGVSGNTTCTSNVCTNATASANAFSVTLTLSSLSDATNYDLRVRNNVSLADHVNASVNNWDYDTTAPTVAYAGNVTNNFVFTSPGRFGSVYPNEDRLLLVKVTDVHPWNCTLYTNAGFNTKGVALTVNRTTGNGPANAFNITTESILFQNMSLHWNILPNNDYQWGVSCSDNATIPNVGRTVSGNNANRTFYYDNTTPSLPAENALIFTDSDSNAKDISTSGLFQIGGIWTTELLETVTFTCDVSEANLASVTFEIKTPGESKFGNVQRSTSKTLDFTDVKKSGVYEVKCITTDIAGNSTTSSIFKFRAQAEDEGEIDTTPYVRTFNIDFSKEDRKMASESAGRILTMTFDGTTEHTVRFEEITTNSVTLTIASHPKTFTLSIGESRNVDLNDDGTDDIAVTLNSITNGKADVVFDKLGGAEAVAREDIGPSTATTTVGPSAGPPTPEARSSTAVWIIVLLVVVGIIIYLIAARRKKQTA